MKTQMESIQSQMAAADKEMGAKRDAIVKQLEQIQDQYTEGTPEFEAQQKRIAEQDTDFRLELVKKRKQFESAQAQVVYNVHSEITELIKYLADNMGTQVVLRSTRQKMDPKKPETVEFVMGQGVLYFNPKVDYTDWILNTLKQRATEQAAKGGQVNR